MPPPPPPGGPGGGKRSWTCAGEAASGPSPGQDNEQNDKDNFSQHNKEGAIFEQNNKDDGPMRRKAWGREPSMARHRLAAEVAP